jgi:hypothetical protein
MAKRKTKFSVNQIVAFRYGDRKIIGKVALIKPIAKLFVYDVLGEDGKLYEELGVDTTLNKCIDTYLTRLFYKKYDISEDMIPVSDDGRSSINDVYMPEAAAATEEVEVEEVDIRDYSVDYDEENPDAE